MVLIMLNSVYLFSSKTILTNTAQMKFSEEIVSGKLHFLCSERSLVTGFDPGKKVDFVCS